MRNKFKRGVATVLSLAMVAGMLPANAEKADAAATEDWYYTTSEWDEIALEETVLTPDDVGKRAGTRAVTGTLLDYNGKRSYALREWEYDSNYNDWMYSNNHVWQDGEDWYTYMGSMNSPSLWSDEKMIACFVQSDPTITRLSERLAEIVTDTNYTVSVKYLKDYYGASEDSTCFVGTERFEGTAGVADQIVECIAEKKEFTTNLDERDLDSVEDGNDSVIVNITSAKKLSLNANGGSCDESTAWYYCKDFDRTEWALDSEAIPVREGYDFAGWYDSQTGGNPVTNQELATTTIHARWLPHSYAIQFDANTGEGTMDNQEMVYDAEMQMNDNSFSKTGYVFAGWNTAADGSGTAYADKQSVVNLASTNGAIVTMYAQWVPAKYTLKFHGNSGEGTMDNQDMSYDVETQINPCTYTKPGYDFDSWNTKADGSGMEYLDGQAVSNLCVTNGEIINLYAQWKKQTVAGTDKNSPTDAASGGSITDATTGSGVTGSSISSNTKKFTKGLLTYKITGAKTVEVVKANKKIKKVTLNTVSWNGKKYKVTSVGKAAFKNCKKLTKVTIGKNVKTIKANAFYGCKKLAKVSIKSTKLTMGKHALKNTKASCKYSFPKAKKKAYKKMVKKARK